jgi:outer membrane lipoprotein-sorting protein
MRHPLSRVTAATILTFVLAGAAFWFFGSGPKAAFADFLDAIIDAKSAKFTTLIDRDGQHAKTIKIKDMYLAPNHFRGEFPDGHVCIVDRNKGKEKMIILDPAKKLAVVTDFTNRQGSDNSKDEIPREFFTDLRSRLLDAKKDPRVKRESLGEKVIDGRRAIGFRYFDTTGVMTLWGDPKTGLPIRVEETFAISGVGKKTMIDFEFDVPLDESLFSTDPPAGYAARSFRADASSPGEKDLIDSLRGYCDLFDGAFPDTFDVNDKTMNPVMEKIFAKKGWEMKEDTQPSQEQLQATMDIVSKIGRGFAFAVEGLPREADAHYAGKGASFGTADKPVFWYRPKDTKKYRIIHGDLSVSEADVPPNVPDSQTFQDKSHPGK